MRNHVVVLSSVSCANGVVDGIGREVSGVKAVTHIEGCGRGFTDVALATRTLVGVLRHPNVYGALAVGLGCEVIKAAGLVQQAADCGKPLEFLEIQETGGTLRSIATGAGIVRPMVAAAAGQAREAADFEELMLAMECGGSDSLSGLTANPCIGKVSDWLVGQGGRVIMSEITEFIGAEAKVAAHCDSPDVRERMMALLADQRRRVKDSLGPLAHLVIAPGNAEGGLSSIEEKSMGSFAKAGSTMIRQVVEYAERPTARGLVVMNTPGSDVFSMTGKIAAGAQILLFSTGRGSPAGSPLVPVVKIASNTRLFERMPDDMDFDAGRAVAGRSLDELGAELRDLVVEVANGRPTKPELTRTELFAINSTSEPF